jgi:hypothetical protein
MYRSSWDLEVYAKHVREWREAEAAWYRLVDEAMDARAAAVNPFNLGIARFVSTVKTWFSSNGMQRAPQVDERGGLASNAQSDGLLETPWRARPRRLSQPYADMVVIARGPIAKGAEQPSGVSDC